MHKKDILREEWTGKLGFILSLTGAAVGLGNIWRFPYLLSEGGGVFVLLYALCMFVLVLPIMFFEIKMGQLIKLSPINAFKKVCAKYKVPKIFVANSYLGLLIVFTTLTFYTVVSGWVMYYLTNAVFTSPTSSFMESKNEWDALLSSSCKMIFFNIIFLLCNFVVLAKGIKYGLEMLNKFMLPGLVSILFFMLIFAAFSEEMVVEEAFSLLFSFELSNLNSRIFISALGQALFTLAVGACAILTYGAYLPEKEGKIIFSSTIIIITQLIISVILGIVIYSLLLGNNTADVINSAGPELIFVVLPVFFAQTSSPQLLTASFFIITFLAAITSSVNIAEPMVYTLTDKFKVSRIKACACVITCIAISSTLLTLSFSTEYDIFGFLIHLVTEIAMPLAAFIFSILAGWFVESTLLKSMICTTKANDFSKDALFYIFAKYSMRFLFPAALLLVAFFN